MKVIFIPFCLNFCQVLTIAGTWTSLRVVQLNISLAIWNMFRYSDAAT